MILMGWRSVGLRTLILNIFCAFQMSRCMLHGSTTYQKQTEPHLHPTIMSHQHTASSGIRKWIEKHLQQGNFVWITKRIFLGSLFWVASYCHPFRITHPEGLRQRGVNELVQVLKRRRWDSNAGSLDRGSYALTHPIVMRTLGYALKYIKK